MNYTIPQPKRNFYSSETSPPLHRDNPLLPANSAKYPTSDKEIPSHSQPSLSAILYPTSNRY